MDELLGFALSMLAVIAGGLVGFEREWRGRTAGFRTLCADRFDDGSG